MAVSKETYKIVVEFRRDQVSGWGNKPQDFVVYIKSLLNQSIPHYLVDVSMQTPFSTDNEPEVLRREDDWLEESDNG